MYRDDVTLLSHINMVVLISSYNKSPIMERVIIYMKLIDRSVDIR